MVDAINFLLFPNIAYIERNIRGKKNTIFQLKHLAICILRDSAAHTEKTPQTHNDFKRPLE